MTKAEGNWINVSECPFIQGLSGHSVVVHKGILYIFGGCDHKGSFTNSLFMYNLKTKEWQVQDNSSVHSLTTGSGGIVHSNPNIPSPRNFHVAVVYKGDMYIHGGKSNGYHADLYKYNFAKKRWTVIPPSLQTKPPLARFGHKGVVYQNCMYIFGGYDQHGFICDAIYQYNFENNTWTKVKYSVDSSVPLNLERFHHDCALYKNTLLVFGGKGAEESYGDLLEFNFDTRRWRVLECVGDRPSPRWGHSLIVIGDTGWVFGGRDKVAHYGDFFKFSLSKSDLSMSSHDVQSSVSSISTSVHWQRVETHLSAHSHPHAQVVLSNTSGSPNSSSGTLLSRTPSPRYFHAAVAYRDRLYIVWGKNLFDFCFKDISEFSHIQMEEKSTLSRSAEKSEAKQFNNSNDNNNNKLPTKPIKIRLKCHFNNEIRVVSVWSNVQYNDLITQLNEQYNATALRIQYEDEEGDFITVRNQSDLDEAFSYFMSKGNFSSNNTFKLYLSSETIPLTSSPEGSIRQQLAGRNRRSTDFSSVSTITRDSGGVNRRSAELVNSTGSNGSASGNLMASPSKQNAPVHRVIKWLQGELIDEGAFGKVFKAMNAETGAIMAVKQVIIPKDNSETNAKVAALQKEIELMKDLSHPHIVRYLGSERVDDKLNIFLEYQASGSIAQLLARFKPFNESLIRTFTKQILLGLDYLHSHGIAHRDIKGGNILVDRDGTVKLADFGASKKLADIMSYSEGCKTVTGSPYWMAPEVIQQGYAERSTYGRKADIWSVGAVIIEMATGKPPWSDLAPVTALFKIGSNPEPPPFPNNLSPLAIDFLTHCFERDPHKRASASELLQHPWLVDVPTPHDTDNTSPQPYSFSFELDKNNTNNSPNNTSDSDIIDSNNNVVKNEKPQIQSSNSDAGSAANKGIKTSSVSDEQTQSSGGIRRTNASMAEDTDDGNDDTAINSVIAFLKDRNSEDSPDRSAS
jgi:serine/threonine protein kinase